MPLAPLNLRVQHFSGAEEALWQEAARMPGASIGHSASWCRAISQTYGLSCRVIGVRDQDRLVGFLPLAAVASWLTGRRAVALPFTDECRPLHASSEAAEILLTAALELGRASRWRFVEVRGTADVWRKRPGYKPSTSFWKHQLDLSRDESSLFSNLDSSTRRAIRKSQTQSLAVKFTQGPEGVDDFYPLLCLTRRRHGLPPQPRRFFAVLHSEIIAKRQGCVAIASLNGRAVAAAVFLHAGGTALYKYGASDERFQHTRANNLLFWESIRWHASRGFRQLDLGRTSIHNEGLRRFKLGWGATESTLDYIRIDPMTGTWLSAPDQATGRHNRFFRALPPPLAKLAGHLLYKHIA